MKKIMFNDKFGLTKAVLEGRKTNTRRVIKLNDGERVEVVSLDNGSFMSYIAKDGCPTAHVGAIDMPNFVRVLVPKYFIGEDVAVAQSYKDCFSASWIKHIHDVDPTVRYDRELSLSPGQDNKMFVRADLMPHRIKITNIRVERLQDISADDCLKEGVKRKNDRYVVENEKGVCFFTNDPILAFRCLIDKTCGKGTWESNPWVFVYDFELVK